MNEPREEVAIGRQSIRPVLPIWSRRVPADHRISQESWRSIGTRGFLRG